MAAKPQPTTSADEALAGAQLEAEESDVTMRPQTSIDLDEESYASIQRLIDALEDLDDVQNVYANADMSE